ncbi:histidine kinase [uncultured Polaribacter sp.]|uniref:tetratricopeptide repeat-containing sensor histidine kinase n=1 Tax=uncultured Polaribacter sp. TaxID=174711 RepID=UPI002607CCF7|nr:histidine kinase [uncultured Polaribacter sp.]
MYQINKSINYFKYFLITYLFISTSCNQNTTTLKKIEQDDIDFIESFKQNNTKEHLIKVDSLLNANDQSEERVALLYLKKGILHSILQEDEKSIVNLEIALKKFKKFNNKKYITETHWLLGSSNAYLSNRVEANKHLLIALQFSKEINEKKTEANVYGTLAHTHYLYEDYSKSIDYNITAINIYKNLKDTLGISSTYNNLAIIYKNIGNYKEALNYNIKSLEINRKQKDTNAIAKSHNNIGNLLKVINNNKEAIKHFKKAIVLNKKKEILNSSPLRNLGDLFLENKNIIQAKLNYTQALDIENSKSSTAMKLVLNTKLLEIALEEKDYERAIFHQQKYDSLNNIQIKKDTQEKLDLVENQYQLSTSQQKLKQQQKINKKNRIIFLIVIGLLLLFALSSFQFRKNKKLKIEKEKMYLEQKVLRSQMNPHFIFNVLSSIQNSLMDNDPIKSATYLSRFAKLFRQNFDFINKKTIPLRDEIDVLENYISAQKLRYKDKFEYEVYVSDTINIDTTEIPPLLLQPFLENAIEHGFKNKKELGKIILNITKKNNAIWYEIIDNGKGFDSTKKSTKTHALDVFKKRLKLLGNDDEKSFEINSSNKGTSIKFRLKND